VIDQVVRGKPGCKGKRASFSLNGKRRQITSYGVAPLAALRQGKRSKAREHKIQKNNIVCQKVEGTPPGPVFFNRNFNSSVQRKMPKRIEYLLSGGNAAANLD
jgi:hypothetical protein